MPPFFPCWISILKWIIKAIGISVKPDLVVYFQLFNDQEPGFLSKNVNYLKNKHFFFSTEGFQMKEKITTLFFQKKTEKRKLYNKAGWKGCQGFRRKNFTLKNQLNKNFFTGTRRAWPLLPCKPTYLCFSFFDFGPKYTLKYTY